MNDLYKKLAGQSADECELSIAWEWERKYAELIINQCVAIVDSFDSCGTAHISYAIQKEFGTRDV